MKMWDFQIWVKNCCDKNTIKTFFPLLNPLTTNVPHHIETSQLICDTNQLSGFYVMGNIGRYWVNIDALTPGTH